MQLQAEGSVLSGDFQVPAQGIVFVLGEGIDAKQAAKTLLPLQLAIQAEKAVAVSVVTGSNDSYRKMLATSKESMPVIQEIEKVTMQVDLVNMLAKQYDAARQAQAAQSAKANQPEPVPANAGHSSSRRRSR